MSHDNGISTDDLTPERELILHAERLDHEGLSFYVLQIQGQEGSPATLNPSGLLNFQQALTQAQEAREQEPFDYLVIAGTSRAFCAGADLGVAERVTGESDARDLAKIGHETFALLEQFPVPTIALLEGLALGGGLELALHCDYRVSTEQGGPFGLPEVSLGIIPGWGGSFLLPHLIGIEPALKMIIQNAVSGRPGIRPPEALDLGLIDHLLAEAEADSNSDDGARSLSSSISGLASAIAEGKTPIQPEKKAREFKPHLDWLEVLTAARSQAAGGSPLPPSADRAFTLLEISATADRAKSREAEIYHLAQGLISVEAKASLYSLNLLRSARKQAKTYAGKELNWQRIALIGAGAMAVQIAVVIASALKLPVYLRDINQEQVSRALAHRDNILEKSVKRGKLTDAAASDLKSMISIGTSMEPFREADLIIEAVSEDMAIKQKVFAELDTIIPATSILASNTSALSISAMAQNVSHPQRVVGIHFFNPVERMPLVEIVQGAKTDAPIVEQAHAFVAKLSKIGITVADAPGFVVNRILLRYLGITLNALERHTPASVVIQVSRSIGLPMNPLQLIDLVSPHVTADVLRSLRSEFGPRFPHSPGLESLAESKTPFYINDPNAPSDGGRPPQILNDAALAAFGADVPAPETKDTLLTATQHALAEEISLMLGDEVVKDSSVIDLGMLLGAGWPNFRGGITPYLRDVGKLTTGKGA